MRRKVKFMLLSFRLFLVSNKPLLIAYAIGFVVMLPLIYVFIDEVIF